MGKKSRKMSKLPEFEYKVNIDSVKARDKFVRRIERIVRGSMEYRDLIVYLKDNMDFANCAFFQNIGGKESKAKIEVHHEPFTLYDICDIVLQKYLRMGFPINDLYIAEEVMELHYRNMVGLVPLSVTVHQMVHPKKVTTEPKVFVPIQLVYGDYRNFIKEYAEDIGDDIYERFERKLDRSKNLTPETFDALMKEFEYLEVEGMMDLQKIEIDDTIDDDSENEVVAA